jgi:hypothetical protein
VLASVAAASAQDAPAPRWAWTSGGLAVDGAIETYSAYYAMSGATQTIGADPFDYDNQGAVRFGSAALGARGTAGS